MLKFLTISLLLAACSDENSGSTEGAVTTAVSSTETVSDSASQSSLRGFVANAFEVTVDGAEYSDLEDFYTKELDRLPEKIKAAGYENASSIRFEAQIGFRDLFQGMDVYALASGSTGYQGTARVGSDGSFNVSFPSNSSTYRIRANKRIRVLVQNSESSSTFCYNFSAIEKAAPLDGEPLILRDFNTSLTKYDCPVSSEVDSLTIPANPSQSLGKVSPGMSKAEVLEAFGSDGLVINGPQWCWRPKSVSELHPNCGSINYLICQCSVTFDSEDLLVNQSNVDTDRLDILSW